MASRFLSLASWMRMAISKAPAKKSSAQVISPPSPSRRREGPSKIFPRPFRSENQFPFLRRKERVPLRRERPKVRSQPVLLGVGRAFIYRVEIIIFWAVPKISLAESQMTPVPARSIGYDGHDPFPASRASRAARALPRSQVQCHKARRLCSRISSQPAECSASLAASITASRA